MIRPILPISLMIDFLDTGTCFSDKEHEWKVAAIEISRHTCRISIADVLEFLHLRFFPDRDVYVCSFIRRRHSCSHFVSVLCSMACCAGPLDS